MAPMLENSLLFLDRRFSMFCIWFMRSQLKLLTLSSAFVPVLQLILCRENVRMLNEMSAVQHKIIVAFPEAKRFLDSHSRNSFKRFAILSVLITSYALATYIMLMNHSIQSFFSYMLASIPLVTFFYAMVYYFAIVQLIIGCQRFLCQCLEENLLKCSRKGVRELLKVLFLMSTLFYAKERFVATLKIPICTVMFGILVQIIFHVR